MAGELARRIVVPDGPALDMASRFGNYNPEEEKAVRKAGVDRSEGLERIMKIWDEYSKCDGNASEWKRWRLVNSVGDISYTSRDVRDFSLCLAAYQDIRCFEERSSTFLNHLIAYGKEKEYTIVTKHLTKLIPNLRPGYGMRVTVDGDAGDGAGSQMVDGELIITGSAGRGAGSSMKAGKLHIMGDAGGLVGRFMTGGSITVEGECNAAPGAFMQGGEIHLEGDYSGDSILVNHGKIYHKGKLIVDK